MSLKLAVGYPWSSPFTFTGFTDHLPNLEHPPDTAVHFFRGSGWCPARRHIHICEQALAWGADLICIIGADQVHPVDLLPRLVARFDEGYEVVAALVPARGYVGWQEMQPFQRMAWRFKRDAEGNAWLNGYRGQKLDGHKMEVIAPAEGEMQEVDFIGSGVLMFHRDHLSAIEKPWFRETVDPGTMQRLANMDCVFVWRLKTEANARVFVDTTIRVEHLHVFSIDETYPERFADWTKEGVGDPSICRYGQVIGGNGKGHTPQTAVPCAMG